jgi:uncharacterized protein
MNIRGPAWTMPWWRLLLAIIGTLCSVWALAQQPVPTLSAHVMDASGTLSPGQLQQLETRLVEFESRRGTQVAVLLVPSTQPEDIASYANRVVNAWKIGRRELGDGLLLLVAVQDRKVRIEVAKTLEGAIPDLAAKRIIDTAITPRFRAGDYAGGIDAGLTQIMALITSENLPAPSAASSGKETSLNDLAVFLFFVLPMAGAIARRALGTLFGALATGGLAAVLAYLVTASPLISLGAALVAGLMTLLWGSGAALRGRGSGRNGPGGWSAGGQHGGGAVGGGFGSGGFGSGGGGDFGGGGASGDW